MPHVPGPTRFPHPLKALLIALLLVLLASVNLNAQEALIEYLEGEVWIHHQDERVSAELGSQLAPGDLVSTGPRGLAVISLGDGARIKLRSSTQVEIEAVRSAGSGSTSVGLRNGGIFARVARAAGAGGPFQVRTPTVVAGVRGTEFFVAYGRTVEERPDVWLCVNEGAVEVAVRDSGARTVVNEGEGINVLNGTRTTDPRFYQWTTELNWNLDPDQGEVRDTTDLDAAYRDLLDQDYD